MAEIAKIADKTEYFVPEHGSTNANIRIGGKDSSVGSKVVPNVNLSYECESGEEKYWINLNQKGVIVDSEVAELKGGWLSLKVGGQAENWFIEGSVLKWDIEIARKPRSNIFEWDLKFAKGVQFFYQAPLEEQYRVDPEGSKTLSEYLSKHTMAEDVIGSYAVYCDKRHHILNPDGSTKVNYGTGKLCHIYRPHATDSNGKSTWCKLFIDQDNNLLRITIPQDFIDNAVYPITLDPDVGNDNCGGSAVDLDDDMRGHESLIGATGGTGDSISACMESTWDATEKLKCALYLVSDGSLVTDGTTEEKSAGHAARAFISFDFTSSPTVTSATSYISAVWGDSAAKQLMRDTTTDNRFYREGITYGAWPDPHGGTYGSSTFNYSTFLTYTETAGGLSIPIAIHHLRQAGGL